MKPSHNCGNIEAYLDGELSPRETLETAGHLASCRECREALAELQALDSMLAQGPDAGPKSICGSVMARVRTMLPHAPRRNPFSGWWKVPALAFASCAVYAVCVETGLLPSGAASLHTALRAQKETGRVYSMLFGINVTNNENLLAMVLEGDEK